MLDERLLEILACPKCKGELEYRTKPEEVLICHDCKLVYQVKEDIPIMLVDQARPLQEDE
ncbi:MAG: Trm112 family protein [Candidatus Aegiribacteria sp.]|nr:Trm112 family protein [Candidatus Aegiribacteria sp.]MBD3294219.1 Trm112 family protein [Candidatus Fermentibacteria bacterium]